VLSYALLLLFVYTSTAAAVHSHTNQQRRASSANSSFLTDQNAPTQTRRSAPSNECLACQFQQNLSNADLFTPHLILSAAVFLPVSDTTAVSFSSLSRTTGHGRAPPVTC
jgi:hypothetical protein